MAARKKKPAAKSTGLDAKDCVGVAPPAVAALGRAIDASGGAVLSSYRDPLGGHWLVSAVLPLDLVEPTPYQRELSPTHAERLVKVIPKVGRFLDPIIAIQKGDKYWTPNGMHRLVAMRNLGAKAITAIVVPEAEVAFKILALNTEKAHNLKDKSLEVIRMARGLAADSETAKRPEADWAFEFEEPAYMTIGLCYEARPRFSGGAYMPVIRRCDSFATTGSIKESIKEREERAKKVLVLDDAVGKAIEALKAAGLTSPYLRPFVIARINPLRWQKQPKPGQKAPAADFEATIDKMIASAKKFDASKIKASDIAATGGPPAED